MTKKKQTSPRSAIIVWALIVVATILSLFALQSVALWLPWRWAYGLAANAVVWPLIQLAVVAGVGLLGAGIWLFGKRSVGFIYIGVSVLCLVPTMQMIVTLHQFASRYHAQPPFITAFHMVRDTYTPDESIKYGRGGSTDLYLSLYRPYRGKVLAINVVKRPTIVYVHGGGWNGGSREENGDFFHWLNDRGYTVLSIDYRVARSGYASWQDAPRDVTCALAWVDTHADERSFDTGQVTLMGDSAGGQLALRAAYGIASGDVTSSCGGQPVIPKSVVGIVPAIDFRELYNDPKLGFGSRANVTRYLGGTPQTAPNAYDESSIITHVKAGLPATLIINAANDTLVSPASGERLAQALKQADVDVQQYTLPYAAHSYWINPGGLQDQTARELMLRFLNKD